MRRPLTEQRCVEAEHSFVNSLANESPVTDANLLEQLAGHFTVSGSTTLRRDEDDPPHFSIASTPTPTIRRRTPGAMAAMLKRRIMRARKQAATSSYTTQSASNSGGVIGRVEMTTGVTMATGATSAPMDSEFGTGFLRVESQAGSGDEGCIEQAEAVLTMSGVTPDDTHDTLHGDTMSSEDVSGRTMTAGSTFERLVTRARRVLRPLADVPVGGRSTSSDLNPTGVGILEPPPGVIFKDMTINGELRIVLTRKPTANEIREDFEMMKQRYPAVPKYEGNPPWLTKFHPDLIRPPSRSHQMLV